MNAYHDTRFSYSQRRDLVWQTLCDAYFQRLIPPDACVLELGTGYGNFINHIRCARRIAVDRWEGASLYLAPEIEAHFGTVTDLGFVPDCSVDFVFASNLFEHMTQDQFAIVLKQVRAKLKPGGTLNILQPNYRFAQRDYFDDYTHIAIYTDRSLTDFLAVHGFRVIECKPRFLPLTVISKWPVWPFLIRLYLILPMKPLGKQMFLRAVVDQ